jgi:chromosome segregation ATPase
MDGVTRIAELQAECDALRAALVEQQERVTQLTTRAIVAERHKALELLSKGSAVEQLEMRLREQLAETEIRAEKAEAESTALRARVEALEADRGRLQDALRHIVEWDDECGCEDHTSEDCCQLQGDADFCARCWAAVALKAG